MTSLPIRRIAHPHGPPTVEPADRIRISQPPVGRVALVPGATRGIGAAVARAFSGGGAAVVLASRHQASLGALAAELLADGGEALAVAADVVDVDAVANVVERTMARFGHLDVACNNAAGVGHRPIPLADVAVEDFDAAVAVNFRGVFLALKYEIPAMVTSGGGAIVNMSSTAGTQAVGALAAYLSTKDGLEGLTTVAALDYADVGIRVNAPRARADPHRRSPAAHRHQSPRRRRRGQPIRRIGRPEEVAAVAVWLFSEAVGFVTGTTLVVDDGKLAGAAPFTVWRGSDDG